MGKIGRGLVGAMVTGALVLPAAGVAHATVPAGTITVGNTGTSSRGLYDAVVAASSGGISYDQQTPGHRNAALFGLPTGSSTPVALTGIPATDSLVGVAGSLAVSTNFSGTMHWENLDATSPGNAPIVPVSSGYSWSQSSISVVSDGWVTIAVGPATTSDVVVVTTGGVLTDLGVSPLSFPTLTAGPAGVVVSRASAADYIPYATPHTPVALNLGGATAVSCLNTSLTAAVCQNSSSTPSLLLVPLDGAAPSSVSIPATTTFATGTASDAAWVTSSGAVAYRAWSGGTITTASTGAALPAASVATDGTHFFFGGGTSVGNAGVASLTPPSSTPVALTNTTVANIESSGLGIGPGRFVWADDAPATGLTAGASPLWSRSLTNSAGTLNAGTADLLYTDGSGYGLDAPPYQGGPPLDLGVSGLRTLFTDTAGNLDLLASDGTHVVVSPPTGTFHLEPAGELSGPRVLWKDLSTGLTHLYDPVAGTNTVVSAIPAFSQSALWGNYLAWMKSDGSVWRMDLSSPTPTPVQVLAPFSGTSVSCFAISPPGVYVSGDWVAWNEQCDSSSGGRVVSGYRNMTTGSPAVDLSTSWLPMAVSGSYLAVEPSNFMSTLSAINLSTSAVSSIGNVSGQVGVDGSTIAWTDPNGVPQATPLTTEPNPPRFLGDQSTPASFIPSDGSWKAEWDTSAVLSSCSVAITSGATPIDTVPCDPAAMAAGDATVSWTGVNSSSVPVPPGPYTWTLSASNGDGAVESPSGGALTLTGSVSVSAGGTFVPLNTSRILDTRSDTGASGPVGAGQTITFQVTGAGTVPATTVGAVVLNVTVTAPGKPGFLTVYAAGATRPTASNLNFSANETIPNLVIVPVGTGGKVSIYNGSTGTVQIIGDASGYFVSGTPGPGGFGPLNTSRILDTRSDTGASGPVGAGQTITFQVTGAGTVPATTVGAVVLNVTVTAPGKPGFLTVYAAGATRPTASNLNFSANETIPNLVIVPVGTGGKVSIYNGSTGTVQIIGDASGYFVSGTPGPGGFGPLNTSRILDTRSDTGASGPVGAGQTITFQVTGAGTVPATTVGAVVLNVTVTAPGKPGFLTVYAAGATRPTASNLNFSANETIPNLVIVPVGTGGKVSIYNGSTGTVQIIGDASGYFVSG